MSQDQSEKLSHPRGLETVRQIAESSVYITDPNVDILRLIKNPYGVRFKFYTIGIFLPI